MNQVQFWIKNARSIALPQSVLPALLAIAAAVKHDGFSWWLALVALFGIICAHLGMNLADDFFDYRVRSGENRNAMASEGIRARIAKYDYLTSGKATVGQLAGAIVVMLGLAALAGFVVLWFRGLPVVYIALGGLFLGLEYSAPPLKLGYHGLGEPVIGLMFGPLLMLGMHYAACGLFGREIVLLSFAAGLLVVNIIFAHSVLDHAADEKVGKMTFARLLGKPWLQLVFVALFNLLPFACVVAGVCLGWFHWAYLSVCLLLPMAIYLVRSLHAFLYGKEISLEPAFWMGPMGNWEGMKSIGIEWFMIRWLVARNLVTFFCLILVIVNLIIAFF